MILRPFDEVGNDQEVAGEAHLVDDVDFEFQPVEIDLPLFLAHLAIGLEPRFEALARVFLEHARLAFQIAREAWQNGIAIGWCVSAALSDHQRVLHRFGQIVEGLLHHVVGLDVAFGIGPSTLLRIDMRRAGDAQHRVVRLMHMRLGKIGRICRH